MNCENNLENQSEIVYVVNLKYLIGWKSIKVDELEETNEVNIIGIYRNKEDAYRKAIEYNKKLLNNMLIYSGEYCGIDVDNFNPNDYDSNLNLYEKYNCLLEAIESKRLVNKYMEQYAVVSEFSIE